MYTELDLFTKCYTYIISSILGNVCLSPTFIPRITMNTPFNITITEGTVLISLTNNYSKRSIPVAARFEALVWVVRFQGFQVRNSLGAWVSISCALSGRGFCNGTITHPEECYRLWRVGVWPLNLYNQETPAHYGLLPQEENNYLQSNLGNISISQIFKYRTPYDVIRRWYGWREILHTSL